MAVQEAGRTTRFIVQYDDAVGPALACAQALLATVEHDLLALSVYLPYKPAGGGDPLVTSPETVIVQDAALGGETPPVRGGANNTGNVQQAGHVIRINPIGTDGKPIPDPFARFLFVAEMAEQLMSGHGWTPNDSQGEALSRVLAETLYTDAAYDTANSVSLAPWVNDWINSSPRADYITTPNPGDTNQVTYGCGILFLYYLQDQLGFSLSQICQAAGSSLGDRYKNLTGKSDDGVTAMGALLDQHYTLPVKLPNDDPFPLFDTAQRSVTLSFARPTAKSRLQGGGTVHTSPFFTCPAKDYQYFNLASTETQSITATTRGFGQPVFTWKVNGITLGSSVSNSTVWFSNVPVDIPNPADIKHPVPSIQTLACGYSDSTSLTRQALSSNLTIWNKEYAGTYNIEVEVEVTEKKDAGKNPTVARTHVSLVGSIIQFDYQYYRDQEACESVFERELSHVPRLQQSVNLVKNAPDPPPGWLDRVITAVEALKVELQQEHGRNPGLASDVARYVAERLRISPRVLLDREQGAEASEHGETLT